MNERKQIVFYCDGRQDQPDVEPDLKEIREIPKQGEVLNRNSRMWEVVHIIEQREMSSGAVPVVKLFLSSQVN